MFKFRLLGLLLITSSAQAMEAQLFTWDDYEAGTNLRVSFKEKDKEFKTWITRETQTKDTLFYQDLLSNPEVTKTKEDGKAINRETTANYVKSWVERFAQGIPWGRMTVEQNKQAVGCVQVAKKEKYPGVGEVAFALSPQTQGKGIGKGLLGFIVEEWAPTVRKIALGQDIKAPLASVDKFRCWEGEELKLLYATVLPSNVASWKCFEQFKFSPSRPTDKTCQISCEAWERSQHGEFEDYIVKQYFSLSSPHQLLTNILYDMIDANGVQRTISFVDKYQSLRYHFEREVK